MSINATSQDAYTSPVNKLHHLWASLHNNTSHVYVKLTQVHSCETIMPPRRVIQHPTVTVEKDTCKNP